MKQSKSKTTREIALHYIEIRPDLGDKLWFSVDDAILKEDVKIAIEALMSNLTLDIGTKYLHERYEYWKHQKNEEGLFYDFTRSMIKAKIDFALKELKL